MTMIIMKYLFLFPESTFDGMTQPLLVFLIGAGGGALSGLLGIGGGIVTAPLLLYLPRLFGLEPLSMHVVGGLTISQALFASLFGGVAHWRTGNVDRRLAGVMSGVIFAAALVGGAGSKWFSHRFLLGLFLLLSLAAAVLILIPQPKRGRDGVCARLIFDAGCHRHRPRHRHPRRTRRAGRVVHPDPDGGDASSGCRCGSRWAATW